MLTPNNMIAPTINTLKKYAIFFKTSISDDSAAMSALGCNNVNTPSQHLEHVHSLTIPNNPHRHILVGKTVIMTTISDELSRTYNIATSEDWKRYDIEDCIPRIEPDTSGKFLPHDINLDKLKALSFDKGCYTGQEIIARMHYRGKLKNHLYKARIESSALPLPGMDIYACDKAEMKICGTIINTIHDKQHGYHILFVSDESSAANHTFFLNADKNSPICVIN